MVQMEYRMTMRDHPKPKKKSKRNIFLKRSFCFFCIFLILWGVDEIFMRVFLTEESRKAVDDLVNEITDTRGVFVFISAYVVSILVAYLFVLWFEKRIRRKKEGSE